MSTDDDPVWPSDLKAAARKFAETFDRVHDQEIRKQYEAEFPPPVPIPDGCKPPYFITGRSRKICQDVARIEADWAIDRRGISIIAPDGETVRYIRLSKELHGRERGTLFYVWSDGYVLPREVMELLDEAERHGWKVITLPQRDR